MNPKKVEAGQVVFSYLGPDLDQGPLPALFYFALSAEESLCKEPYNQPTSIIDLLPCRVFSLSLPLHDGSYESSKVAIDKYLESFAKGVDLIFPFIESVYKGINILIDRKDLLADQIGLMGLSRGAIIATYIGARANYPIALLSPLTSLSTLNLSCLTSQLEKNPFYIAIGNRDLRVGSAQVIDFFGKLCKNMDSLPSYLSLDYHLSVYPSIGAGGHGTPEKEFKKAIEWMAKKIGSK